MASRREHWLAERQRIVDELREKEPDLVRDLEACDAAIAQYDDDKSEPSSDEYARYYLAHQAITAFLEKRGRAAEEEVIIQGIIDGGWMRGNDRASVNLKNSIGYMVRNAREKRILKQFPSGRIGLYGWTAEYDRR